MGRLIAALRTLFTDPEPALGFLEVLAVGPAGGGQFGSRQEVPPARSPEEIGRVLAWIAGAGPGAVGFPDRDELVQQIVSGHAEAGAPDQARIRKDLASILESPGDPRFESVLRVAARLPLPEAKPTLLRLLTMPLYAAGQLGVDSPGGLAGAGSGNGHRPINGRAPTHDLRPAVIAALASLRDPRLKPVFDTLLAKYGECGLDQPTRLHIRREAAVALVILDPKILGQGLPQELLTDLLFLNRLACSLEPEVRRALGVWVNSLPQPTRSRLAAGLAALGGRSSR